MLQQAIICSSKKVLEPKRVRMNVEDDRLSVLPDDLLLKILSFVGLKDAIGTSVLSPRWRYLWKSVPHLYFSSEDFSTTDEFSNVVTHALSHRNNQTQLSSFKLNIRAKDGQDVALKIMNHALSLNVRQLNIKCLFTYCPGFFGKIIKIPLSLSGSQTLKHLTLSWVSGADYIILASTREFSSLTTLHLYDIRLSDGFLSMCPNLENMTLHHCKMAGSEVLTICHPRLSILTLENGNCGALIVNVVTPKLKDLTITKYCGEFQIFAPELVSLLIRGRCPHMFSTHGFHSLEKAQLSLHSLKSVSSSNGSTIIGLLREFHNVKFLSLSADVIKLLNSCEELISHQPSPLAKLESLKILPKIFCVIWHKRTKICMSTKVRNYLLNRSPKATLTEVRRKHCCDVGAGAREDSI